MAYIPTGLGALDPEQTKALYDVKPKEIRELDPQTRIELAFQHADYKARKKEAFWNAVQGFATGIIPILAFFGLTRLFPGRG